MNGIMLRKSKRRGRSAAVPESVTEDEVTAPQRPKRPKKSRGRLPGRAGSSTRTAAPATPSPRGARGRTGSRSGNKTRTRRSRPAAQSRSPLMQPPIDDVDDDADSPNYTEDYQKKLVNLLHFLSSDDDEDSDQTQISNRNRKRDDPSVVVLTDDELERQNNSVFVVESGWMESSTTNTNAGSSQMPVHDLTSPSPQQSGGQGQDQGLDEILAVVDDVVADVIPDYVENEAPTELKDLNNIEHYRKQTEDMLEHAFAVLDGKKEERPERTCVVCLESMINKRLGSTLCGHIYCYDCIMEVAKTLKTCPICRTPISTKKVHSIFLNM